MEKVEYSVVVNSLVLGGLAPKQVHDVLVKVYVKDPLFSIRIIQDGFPNITLS